MTFRTDIAGLRAWAVGLVVLYHFNVSGFSGGFIGVDVFFVISGFLMGGILDRSLRNPQRPRFWVISFLLARAQRIWPALFVLVAFWMAWGWWFLLPPDLLAASREAQAALFFTSNDFYARRTDYFATSSDLRLFLHSWSLSVEWMFYLALAALAFALSWLKSAPRAFFAAVLLLSLASFLRMTDLMSRAPGRAFFELAPRIWEMGAGVIACQLGRRFAPQGRRPQMLLEGTGCAMIVASFVIAGQLPGWPGPVTLLPVLGTALILISARQNSPLTAPRPLQALGEISYSLYLWHWPVSIALAELFPEAGAAGQIAGIAVSLFAGSLSWALVERPMRRRLVGRAAWLRAGTLILTLPALVAMLGVIHRAEGFPSRLPAELRADIARITARSDLDKNCFAMDGHAVRCQIGDGPEPDLLLVGDSHAGAMLGALSESDLARSRRIDLWFHGACVPIFDTRTQNGATDCAQFLQKIEPEIDRLPAHIPLLIIGRFAFRIEGENSRHDRRPPPEVWLSQRPAAFSPEFRHEMAMALGQGICRIGKGRAIFVLEPTPELREDPMRLRALAALRGYPYTSASLPQAEVAERLSYSLQGIHRAGQLCGARLIPARDLLCSSEHCSSWHQGDYAYRDDDHLSAFGAGLLIPRLEEALRGF